MMNNAIPRYFVFKGDPDQPGFKALLEAMTQAGFVFVDDLPPHRSRRGRQRQKEESDAPPATLEFEEPTRGS
jgi:hypothetical protein